MSLAWRAGLQDAKIDAWICEDGEEREEHKTRARASAPGKGVCFTLTFGAVSLSFYLSVALL